MSEAHRIEYVVTEEMTEPAVRAYMAARRLGVPATRAERVWGWVLVAAFVGSAVYAWAAGGFNWGVVVCALVAAFFALMYEVPQWHYRSMRTGFRDSVSQLKGVPVVWTLRADAIHIRSALADREIPWPTIRGLYCGREFWVLDEASGRTTVTPNSALSETSEQFFLEKARAAGARIHGDFPGVEADYDDGPANNRS